MAEDDSSHKVDAIESAMSRLAGSASVPDTAEIAKSIAARAAGRREYDQALSRRLDQIRTALGTDEPPPAAAFGPTTVSALAAQSRVGSVSVIALTALVSALAGAGLTWLALGGAAPARPTATMPMAASVQTLPAGAVTAAPDMPFRPEVAPAPVATTAATPAPFDAGNSQARDLVERWRTAWAGRDVDGYLGVYSAAFVPADGSTRPAWAAARRKNISSRSDISVSLNDVQITRIGTDQAKVVFLQDYAAGTYRETAKAKTLLLTRTGDDWRIAGEWMGERP